MNLMPSFAIEAVRTHDYQKHMQHGYPNRNRFYKFLVPDGDDMEIFTVACKAKRNGAVCAKEVVRASVDDPFLSIRDVACCFMGGYMVDWSREGVGPDRSWGYSGRWETEPYAPRCKWKINCEVINPDALLSHPRFRYCSWTPACGEIIDYLKVYAKHPRAELLSKAGIGWMGTRGGFVRQLEADKGLSRFMLDNLDEIKLLRCGVDIIRMAYRRGISMAEANRSIGDRRKFRGYKLPRSVDATKAIEYAKRHKCSHYRYCEYLQNVQKLGLDLADTKNTFPRRFVNRSQIVYDQVRELDRVKNIEQAKEQDKQIAEVAKRFTALERGLTAYRVTLPRRTADLIREGKRLHNCLGDGHHAAKMARGEVVLAFVRRSERPGSAFVAVEYSPKQRMVLQCYAAKNQRPPEQVIKFVNRWFLKKGNAA